jgi:hypothetical protein
MDASASLESFCLLAKNARGRAAVQIIQEATAAPGLFAFGELLDMPNVQQVRSYHPKGLMRSFPLGGWATPGWRMQRTWWKMKHRLSSRPHPACRAFAGAYPIGQGEGVGWALCDRLASQPLTPLTDPAALDTPRLMREDTID